MSDDDRITLTIDTSVVLEEDEADAAKAASIRFLAVCDEASSILVPAVSTRFEADKAADTDAARVARHFARIEPYERPPAAFRLDVGFLDVDVLSGTADEGDIIEELEALFTARISGSRRFVHSTFDADHVWAHWTAKREYFVTADRQALGPLRSALSSRFGIRVLAPMEFLEAFDASPPNPDAPTLRGELARVHAQAVK